MENDKVEVKNKHRKYKFKKIVIKDLFIYLFFKNCSDSINLNANLSLFSHSDLVALTLLDC